MTKMFNFIAVNIVGDGQHVEEEYEFTVSLSRNLAHHCSLVLAHSHTSYTSFDVSLAFVSQCVHLVVVHPVQHYFPTFPLLFQLFLIC